jgi:hypothetical protein
VAAPAKPIQPQGVFGNCNSPRTAHRTDSNKEETTAILNVKGRESPPLNTRLDKTNHDSNAKCGSECKSQSVDLDISPRSRSAKASPAKASAALPSSANAIFPTQTEPE